MAGLITKWRENMIENGSEIRHAKRLTILSHFEDRHKDAFLKNSTSTLEILTAIILKGMLAYLLI